MKKFGSWENKLVPYSTNNLFTWPILLLGLALLLAGCSSLNVSVPAPETGGPAMALASGLYQRGASLPTLAIRGGASFTSDNKRNYFKFEALVLKPGHLLFTALDPAGRPAFKLVSDGQTLTGIIYGSRQYAIGPATAANFALFLPLGISPNQLIALMSGAQVQPFAAAARSTGDSTELTIHPFTGQSDAGGELWRLRLDGPVDQNPARARITSANFGPAREPDIAIKYMAIKDVTREDLGGELQQEPFPHSLEISWTDQNEKMLRVTYDEVRLGLPLDVALFTLARPDGFELIQLY